MTDRETLVEMLERRHIAYFDHRPWGTSEHQPPNLYTEEVVFIFDCDGMLLAISKENDE